MRRVDVPAPRIRPWVRSAPDRVAEYGQLSIRRHEVCDAHGVRRKDAFTLGFADWCTVVGVTRDERIVLIWQYRVGIGCLSLELPGGAVDGEETPEQAARRELREESGFVAERLEPLGIVHPNPALQGNVHHSFLAHGVVSAGATKFDEDEECEPVLVPLTEAAALLANNQITHALSVAALASYLLSLK